MKLWEQIVWFLISMLGMFIFVVGTLSLIGLIMIELGI